MLKYALAPKALGIVGDQRAIEPLIASLRDPNFRVRNAAENALIDITDPRALPGLEHLAREESDSLVRHSAQRASDGIEQIIAALEGHIDVGLRTAIALSRIGDPRAVKPLIAVLDRRYYLESEDAKGALKRMGTTAVAPLIAALSTSDAGVRASLAELLGEIGDPQALPELKRLALEDKDKSVNWRGDNSESGTRSSEEDRTTDEEAITECAVFSSPANFPSLTNPGSLQNYLK